MLETPDEVRLRLTREAEDRLATRLQNATSVSASDGALHNHRFAIKRIDALTDEELSARAVEVEESPQGPSGCRM